MSSIPPQSPRWLRTVAMAVALLVIAVGVALASSTAKHAKRTAPHAALKAAPSPFTGHWEADMQGDGKVFTFVFDLTTKGDSLGGVLSIANRDGEVPIAGTVKGNHIHFEQFGLWDGAIEGANLKLTRGLDGGKIQHMTAHRAPKS